MAMVDPAKTIVSVGECMLELSQASATSTAWRLHSGGDTYNSSVYLARMGFDVRYFTALGKDQFSTAMREEWTREGIATDLVLTHPTRAPGLYAIEVDEQGERSFTYWRGESAARKLFDCSGADRAIEQAARAKLLLLSGVTLAIFDTASQEKIVALARTVRNSGGTVAFDGNYRARLWPDASAARRMFDRIAPMVTIALPSLEDHAGVYGPADSDAVIRHWKHMGVSEIVVKQGINGASVHHDGTTHHVAAPTVTDIRDTTGAGDAFNAAYLAGRLSGQDPQTSATSGNRLAGTVIKQSGAVIPKVTMPLGLPKAD